MAYIDLLKNLQNESCTLWIEYTGGIDYFI